MLSILRKDHTIKERIPHFIKKVFLVFVLLLCLLYGYRFYDGLFSIRNITFKALPERKIEDFVSQNELEKILSQPFSFIDQGKQSFVFESQDGKYVLKFFNSYPLRPEFLSFSSQGKEHFIEKQKRLFDGYYTAYVKDRDRSGLLFVRLYPDHSQKWQITVYDYFGVTHRIALNNVPFIIQEKAIPTRKLISELLRRRDLEEAKKRFRSIFELYWAELKNGIHDNDRNLMYNTGFIQDRPIRIDLGRLQEDPSFTEKEIAIKELQKLREERIGGWLHRHFPQYKKEITEDLQKKIFELSLL